VTPPPVAALGDRFDEAIDAFRETAPAFDAAFDEIRSAASSRAFTIAGVTRADVVASVWRAMDVAIASGEAMATFRAAVLPALASAWGVSGDKAAPRVETIFRTNAAVAYNAGRYRQARHPDTVRLRPIWRFDALLDGRTSSICRTCHGTTLPADHPRCRYANLPALFQRQLLLRGGGQHVNKTSSAVRITHIPSGIMVACQQERSQHKNKDKAMSLLRAKLLAVQEEAKHAKEASARKAQIGTGDRSEKIRTYNFPQDRITDHRIKTSWSNIAAVMEGGFDQIFKDLQEADRQARLAQAAAGV
jgi:hypothetical protein